MRFGVTGASGLVGSALCEGLRQRDFEVIRIVRRDAGEGEIRWDPSRNELEASDLANLDGVIHLAGESIASGRWNGSRKRRIVESRTRGTSLLSQRLAEAGPKPRLLISASAIGFYGDCGSEPVDESAGPGDDFLADTCRQWENACEPAREAGLRVVNVRIGIVLSRDGGALQKMLTPFKMGVGGVIGSGQQYWSWIILDDLVRVFAHLIEQESVRGPVNAVSPASVTNATFTKALGRTLRRPTIFPMPAFVARLALGEMANALLLSSARVQPTVLLSSGFEFLYVDLDFGLRHTLNQS